MAQNLGPKAEQRSKRIYVLGILKYRTFTKFQIILSSIQWWECIFYDTTFYEYCCYILEFENKCHGHVFIKTVIYIFSYFSTLISFHRYIYIFAYYCFIKVHFTKRKQWMNLEWMCFRSFSSICMLCCYQHCKWEHINTHN